MAPTPLAPTDRYIHPETIKCYWVESIADITAPTRAELDAGTDLTAEVADATGWEVSAERQPVPDAGSGFTARVTGRINPGDSQITFWADRATMDIRDTFSRGDQGNIVWLWGGDVPAQKMDVFPVEVSAVGKPVNIGGEPARIVVDFSIRRLPAEDVPVPAAP